MRMCVAHKIKVPTVRSRVSRKTPQELKSTNQCKNLNRVSVITSSLFKRTSSNFPQDSKTQTEDVSHEVFMFPIPRATSNPESKVRLYINNYSENRTSKKDKAKQIAILCTKHRFPHPRSMSQSKVKWFLLNYLKPTEEIEDI